MYSKIIEKTYGIIRSKSNIIEWNEHGVIKHSMKIVRVTNGTK